MNLRIMMVFRTMLLVSVLLLVLFGFMIEIAHNQQILDPPRVVLDYRCPGYVLSGRAPIIMRADLIGAKALLSDQEVARIFFSWSLSDGRLVTGQRTGTIVIDPSGLDPKTVTNLDVRLEIEGAPPEVERDKTCKLKVDPNCEPPIVADEYGAESPYHENRYLDRFGAYLKTTGPESVAFIVSYSGSKACAYEAQWRADNAKNYLVDNFGIAKERIVVVDGGVREKWNVELFIQASGTCGPLPNPTLSKDDARVTGDCADKYRKQSVYPKTLTRCPATSPAFRVGTRATSTIRQRR
jgi:hypothetical protein